MSDATAVSDASQVALGADVATALYGVNGSNVKIGIISSGYDTDGGAAADVAAGYLPPNVTVLSDLSSPPPGGDEGRAMMELAYQIAPEASYYYATGGTTAASCAAAVTALQNAGCTIIIDDLGYADQESFYQTGSVLDNAISAAVAAGVNYFSAAGNDGSNYYQQGFAPLSTTIQGIGTVTANDFGNGSPYLDVTIPQENSGDIVIQWAQPFATYGSSGASAGNSLALYLFDADGNLVDSSTTDEVGGNPLQDMEFTNDTNSTDFRLVVVENGNVVPADENFTIFFANSGLGTFATPAAGSGTGAIFGHELLAGTNVVGAVNYANTPALGVSTPVPETYSSSGPGVILYDAQGNPLPAPVSANEPTFASVDGSTTSVPGFLTFAGTSAAAPNAGAVGALMLQANSTLSTTEVTALLEQSAIPVSTTLPNAGAGLIQARAAVELAVSAAGAVWSNAAGGDWALATSWSTGAVPATTAAAMIGNDLGALTASYSVTVDTNGDAAGSLTLSAPTGLSVRLVIAPDGTLAIGGPSTDNRTAGDCLVATGGTLSAEGGSLTVAGSLNVNGGAVSLAEGAASAGNYTQNAGALAVGGGAGAASLSLSDTTGISQTGGATSILADGTITTTVALFSASSVGVDATTAALAIDGTGYLLNSTLTVSGRVSTAALNLYSAPTTIAQTGTATAASLAVGASSTATAASVVTVDGTLIDLGGLTGGTLGTAGTIDIGATGFLEIGGAASAAAIGFLDGGMVDFASSDAAVLTDGLDAVISGFDDGSSVIAFGALTYDAADTYAYADGSLSILDGSTDLATLSLDPAASYGGFDLMAGSQDQLEVATVPCFAAGTRILTDRGEVAVEALRIGDQVIAPDGTLEPIVWIGSRMIDCRRHPNPAQVFPVLMTAHAFGPCLPSRNLLLSPDHAVFMEQVLIPVKHLVNGDTVRQIRFGRIHYFHVELGRHGVVLAEGLPTESYLDTGDRPSFVLSGVEDGMPRAWRRAGGDVSLLRDACAFAPLCVSGPEVERVRARLRRRPDPFDVRTRQGMSTPETKAPILAVAGSTRRLR
jgi:hypothetical protein